MQSIKQSMNDTRHANPEIIKQKKGRYGMFDDVLFIIETRDKHKDKIKRDDSNKKISKAEEIVNEFILELQNQDNEKSV